MAEEQKRGLEGAVIADTRLSRVMGDVGRLVYCGYEISDLADNATYEEVVFLLWNQRLPSAAELEALRKTLFSHMALSEAEIDVMRRLPVKAHPMGILRTAVSTVGVFDPEAEDNSPEANQRKALRLTAKMPTIIAAWSRIRTGKELLQPRADFSLAENFLYMLNGKPGSKPEVDALNAYLVLLADHGMNASTFTSRVVTSTDGDMYSAITAAIGSLKGPKHGGANEAAMRMFFEIGKPENVEKWFKDEVKGKGRRIMGVGHRVYKAFDPRADVLKRQVDKLGPGAKENPVFLIATGLEKQVMADPYFVERKLFPNVDYYSSIVLDAIGVDTDLQTPLFAMSRIAGWSAQVMEQWTDNRLIRPLDNYIGPMDLKWVPVNQRG
ncbi:MAG: citrate/2-methylcitrate synthase [Chloroflexi bacterium]|nr:citrate/2-methylcitrate synthase [Chloroflexota bacterium]